MRSSTTTGGLFTDLIKYAFRLENQKHISEATAAGLTIIGLPDKSVGQPQNYLKYQFNDCGHCFDFQITHVRRKSIKCKICLEQKYKTAGEDAGFTYVSLSDSPDHRMYRREACGHVLKLRVLMLGKRVEGQTGGNSCYECYELKLKEDAEKIQMTYLGEPLVKSGVFRRYKFNSCGHVRDVNAACVARGKVQCSDCIVDKFKEEARVVGLIYNGAASTDKGIKRNYILECGHTKDIRLDHVRNGSWSCDVCGNTHYTKPSSIYLFKIKTKDFQWLKLGYSKDVEFRSVNYGLPKDAIVENLFEIKLPTGLEALHIEKSIHRIFKKQRLCSKFMRQYHKYNGFSECYSICTEKDLLNELSKVAISLEGEK